MVKTCSKCGKTKDVKEFRILKTRQSRCSYCKKCESDYTKEYRAKYRKQNLRRGIEKTWAKLCEIMDPVELDKELYVLREIYKREQESKHEQEF